MTRPNKMIDGEAVPLTDEEFAAYEANNAAQAAAEAAFAPPVVTMAQAQIALLRAGLLDRVNAAIANQGGELAIWWAKSTIVERSNRFVAELGAALGLSSDDIDALFRTASAIK